MGSIHIALDETLQRQVALKVMHLGDATESQLRRFEQEARIIAQLRHPNIVQVYDYGLDDRGEPYIVMELLEGEDLSQVMVHSAPMPLAAVVPLVMETARGLHMAHRLGVIHRDLKPANIFLSRQNGEQTLKILDFGVATFQTGEDTSDKTKPKLVGTPAYMSPEQAQGLTVDARADLWSLAVVAYQALTGHSPFGGRTLMHTVMRVVHEPTAPPSTLVEALGAKVDQFFERALAKPVEKRFGSALEFAAAFSALTQSETQRPATILVVDDEPDLEVLMRHRFRHQVRHREYELLFARDGVTALDQLALRPDIDVVFTDLRMPGMDGLTLLERLGQVGPALRSVVLSAYGDLENIRAAMNAGAYDFLTKPLDYADLQATLKKSVAEARKLRRALRSIEENDALRLVVDDALMVRLLPLTRISGDLGGETIDATVLSIDVCGTRSRVRQGPATAAVELLNRTFERVVPPINAWQGVVVSFVGDAALVLFEGDDHLQRAGSACVGIQRAMADAQHAGLTGVCIGLDTGPVLSCNIGSRRIQRLNYTVLGDVVSRAIALEHLAGAGQILARRDVARRLPPQFVASTVEASLPDDHGLLCEIDWATHQDWTEPPRSATVVLGKRP